MTTLSEITKGLSAAQKKAFVCLLADGGWVSPYRLGFKITTLDSLFNKGLVLRRTAGTVYWPGMGNREYKSKYRKKAD